jgi:hypothetical protein
MSVVKADQQLLAEVITEVASVYGLPPEQITPALVLPYYHPEFGSGLVQRHNVSFAFVVGMTVQDVADDIATRKEQRHSEELERAAEQARRESSRVSTRSTGAGIF